MITKEQEQMIATAFSKSQDMLEMIFDGALSHNDMDTVQYIIENYADKTEGLLSAQLKVLKSLIVIYKEDFSAGEQAADAFIGHLNENLSTRIAKEAIAKAMAK